MATITGSVGRGGVNNRFDVIAIQSLLNSSALPPSPKLVTDGSAGPLTFAAIEAYQRGVVKGVVDGRVDVNGATFKSLNGDGICRFEKPDYSALIAAVDSQREIQGAGIVLVHTSGAKVDVRGGPRRLWVWITPPGLLVQPAPSPSGDAPAPVGFWDRWGGAVLNCGSAVATGVVIGLSGGSVGVVAGAFAVNSALLCGTSLGKAIEYDAWKEFEKQGGSAYRAWLTTETLLSLIDLCNGVKSSASLLKTWGQAGQTANKLAKLQTAVKGKKLTKLQLLAIIQEIDPIEGAKIGRSSTRARVLGVGQQILKDANFVSVPREAAKLISDTVGNALSLIGSTGTVSGVKATWDVWLVNYDSAAKPQ